MSVAGQNEADFRRTFEQKFGVGSLGGKRSYRLKLPDYQRVETSVDETILLPDGRLVLVEIDSGNMAKLLAGQYALLNGLCQEDRKTTLFLVVHYYVDRKNKNRPYEAHRTTKNLNAIQSFAPGTNWLPYNAINISDMRRLIEESQDLVELGKRIWPLSRPAVLSSPTAVLQEV